MRDRRRRTAPIVAHFLLTATGSIWSVVGITLVAVLALISRTGWRDGKESVPVEIEERVS